MGGQCLPPEPLGALAGGHFQDCGDVLLPQLPIVDVPDVPEPPEVRPEGLEPMPPGVGVTVRSSPIDVAADRVVPPLQVIEDHQIQPRVLIHVGDGQGAGGFRRQAGPARLAVGAPLPAPVNEGGQGPGVVGVIVGHDDVQIPIPVQVRDCLLQ